MLDKALGNLVFENWVHLASPLILVKPAALSFTFKKYNSTKKVNVWNFEYSSLMDSCP
jgi:hypothetical protein